MKFLEKMEETINFLDKNNEYRLEINLLSKLNETSSESSEEEQLSMKISKLYDIRQWKLLITEEQLIKQNKNWRVCIGIESVYCFIKECLKNKTYELNFSEKQLSFFFPCETSFQKLRLSIILDEVKSDIETCISVQASSIRTLCDKITNLEKKSENIEKEVIVKSEIQFSNFADKIENSLKTFQEEIKSLKLETIEPLQKEIHSLKLLNEMNEKKFHDFMKILPKKPLMATIFDCGSQLSSPSTYYLNSWQNVDKALGKLNLETKSSIFWECYMSSLYANGNYQLACRIEITNCNNQEKSYWPKNKLQFVQTYVPATYFPLFKFSDCSFLEKGQYTFQLQIKYSSNSASYPFYIYGGESGGEVKMTTIYFDYSE